MQQLTRIYPCHLPILIATVTQKHPRQVISELVREKSHGSHYLNPSQMLECLNRHGVTLSEGQEVRGGYLIL